MPSICLLKAKLHRAAVTSKDLDYEGSIAIDVALLGRSGIRPFEKVLVINITTGQRFETYAIPAPAGSREISVNGGAARLCEVGDRLVIMAFIHLHPDEAHEPTVVILDEENVPVGW